jgi:GT2 family glycosyltransferase
MIYVLLPVHNRRPTTEAFAKALARQNVEFHLLLIDDGSTDGTGDAVAAALPGRVTVVRGNGNWWWGGSLHQGWLWLKARGLDERDVVFICNDDVDIPDDFIASGTALLAARPRAIVVAKARNAATGASEETCYAIDYRRCQVALAQAGTPALCAPTRGLFIRWSDMRAIGGFHPHLLPHYLSDLEWTLRAHRHGLPIIQDDRLWLTPHPEKTGFHGLGGLGFGARLRRMFSIKYAVNPLHWCAFVLLGFPARYWLPALARVGLWTMGGMLGKEKLFADKRSVSRSG